MKQYVGIIRDHSGSMSNVKQKAMDDYNLQLHTIQSETKTHNIDTIASVLKCGVQLDRYRDENKFDSINSNIHAIRPLTSYEANGRSTPLYDAVGKMIETLKSVPDASSLDVSFLVCVITDGFENASTLYNAQKLKQEIATLHQSDRWTFTFRTPVGSKANLVRLLGLYEDNVIEWETSTAGLTKAAATQSTSLSSYYSLRASGFTSTRSFYKPDTANIKVEKLVDVTNQFKILTIPRQRNGSAIRDFCIDCLGSYSAGEAYYQLTKSEKLQASKSIVVLDKTTGKMYSGADARSLLGLPTTHEVKVAAPDRSKFEVFVQSKSSTRKLVGETSLLYHDW